MSPGVLTLLTFLAATLAVVGLASILSDLFLRDRARASKRVDEVLRKHRDRAQRSALFKDLRTPDFGGHEEDQDPTPGLRERFALLLEQSGLTLGPQRLLGFMAGAGLAAGPVAGLLLQSVVLGVIAALLGAASPLLYVLYKRHARLQKLMAQLPDAFDLMARVVRAGQTMSQAIQGVADEFDEPAAGEFALCFEQQNLGLPAEVALRDLARRTGLLEIRIFVVALLVQQQTGGNLAELLDRLAAMIRERIRMKSKTRALTAEGRMQALVLLALPLLLFVVILCLNPSYGQVLLKYPALLGVMVTAEALGAVCIHRIVNFDF
jgi:tight adherence protein B